jgi:translocation and assembly module TamB
VKLALKIGAAVVVALLLLWAAGGVVVRTDWFREKLRLRAIFEMERATGGRVEIGTVNFDPSRWYLRLDNVTIHGREGAGERPLFHARTVEVTLRILSFLSREVNIASLAIVQPEVAVSVAADGTTNVPEPKYLGGPREPLAGTLLDVAVRRFELQNGTLRWNDRRYALESAAEELRAQLRYEQGPKYTGRFESGRAWVPSSPRLPALERFATDLELTRDRLVIQNLEARTKASTWKSSGVVANLQSPLVKLEYTAVLDARELAAAAPSPELRGGRLEMQGSLAGSASTWTTEGKFSADGVEAAAPGFRVHNAAATGRYAANPQKLTVDSLRARLLGGAWVGRLTAGFPPAGRLQLEGRLEGMRLEAMAEALASPAHPLDQAGWSAVVSGPLNLQSAWPPSARSVAIDADLTLAPPDAGARVPVEGVVRASYQGPRREVQLQEVRLATRATSLRASGSLGEGGAANIEFRLQTSNLDELTAAVRAASGEAPQAPVKLSGSVDVSGRASGTLERPLLVAKVNAAGFTYEGRSWDSFTGGVEWSLERLRVSNGRLVNGRANLRADLTARLEQGRITGSSPLEAEVSVSDVEAQDLAALAQQNLPATGAVTASFQMRGTADEPRGNGTIEVRKGTAWQEPFDSLRARVEFERHEIHAREVRLVKGKSVLTGQGSFQDEKRAFAAEVRADNVLLGDQQWLARLDRKVEGRAGFTFTGTGALAPNGTSLETLTGKGTLELRDALVDGERVGTLSATAQATGDRVQFEGRSDLLGSQLTAQGEVRLREPYPLEARVEIRQLDLPAALRAAGAEPSEARGSADGQFRLSGNLLRPDTLTAQGSVTRLELGWAETTGVAGRLQTLRNGEPVTWRVANQTLTLDAVHLVGEGSDLKGAGSLDLGTAGTLKLNATGNLNLGVLGALYPRLKTEGFSTLNLNVTGTRRQPVLGGRLEVRGVRLGAEDVPLGLSNGTGVILFAQQHASIQKFTGEAGGGDVSLAGDVDFSSHTLMYRLRVEAEEVRLRYPAGLSSLVNATLTLTGTNERSLLEGEIEITRTGTRQSVDLATVLAGLKQPPRTPSSSGWLQGAQLNVRIVSSPDIRLETSMARNLQADINLQVRGTALNPALVGRINITEGEIVYQGTHFILSRGDITFVNPVRIEPVLNMDLETRVSSYDITLTLVGSLDKLNVTYRSDPPLTFNEVITLLAVGRAPTVDPTLAAQQTSQARGLTELGATNVIGQALTRPATGRLERFFGVSRLKVDPEFGGPTGTANARLTIEQQVGRDVTFTYTYSLASAQEQIIRIEWAINRQWSAVAIRDQNGLFGVDFLYRRRYR